MPTRRPASRAVVLHRDAPQLPRPTLYDLHAAEEYARPRLRFGMTPAMRHEIAKDIARKGRGLLPSEITTAIRRAAFAHESASERRAYAAEARQGRHGNPKGQRLTYGVPEHDEYLGAHDHEASALVDAYGVEGALVEVGKRRDASPGGHSVPYWDRVEQSILHGRYALVARLGRRHGNPRHRGTECREYAFEVGAHVATLGTGSEGEILKKEWSSKFESPAYLVRVLGGPDAGNDVWFPQSDLRHLWGLERTRYVERRENPRGVAISRRQYHGERPDYSARPGPLARASGEHYLPSAWSPRGQERQRREIASYEAAVQAGRARVLAPGAAPPSIEYEDIYAGDHVTFEGPQGGLGRGRAMRLGPAGWILDTGARVNEESFVSARRGNPVERRERHESPAAEARMLIREYGLRGALSYANRKAPAGPFWDRVREHLDLLVNQPPEMRAGNPLRAMPRKYQCRNCGHVQTITTNHLGSVIDYCGRPGTGTGAGCSWKPSFGNPEYRIPDPMGSGRTFRPFDYLSPEEERRLHERKPNPHRW